MLVSWQGIVRSLYDVSVVVGLWGGGTRWWGRFSINLGGLRLAGAAFNEVLDATQSGSSSFAGGYKVSSFLGWG